MVRRVGNGNHQCRGSGIKTASVTILGTKSQKSKMKKAVSKRQGWGGKMCLKNVGKSLNK